MSDDSIDPVHPGARVARAAFAPARRPHAWLLPTLFDRLRDEAPSQRRDAMSDVAASPARLREIVRRDLSILLDTTSAEDRIDRARHALAAASTLNFGLPAFAGGPASQRRWSELERMLRRAIRDYEPRLIAQSLRIVPLAGAGLAGNELRFEIHALIDLRPCPLEFMVHSTLDLESRRVSVAPSAR
ncbi:type VI secretion system baseplate subunit TssE [Variovorax sp. CY25R-8]|jgi:type VI secretion system protein ImpF|uniref:type VI secretion system baseplate subunit TssE n=1 Tax=Variovorax TaxID=34072 RepID=UPI0009E67927|nr:type VI secretion system baseplate subunit TssE [Variovorax sp. CY25R-8]MCT8174317.1 type VI secretion system baseplate subunit TssE [Variovorax sp. CY25R-8]